MTRVLCVDDDEDILVWERWALGADFSVTTASDALEAIALIREGERFDVVVSDLYMPGLDGSRFLHRVRELAPSTRRIVLSACGDIKCAIEAVNEGRVEAFLVKPCRPEELRRAVREAVAERRPEEELRERMGRVSHEVANMLMILRGAVSELQEQSRRGEVPDPDLIDDLFLATRQIQFEAQALRQRGRVDPRDRPHVDVELGGLITDTLERMRSYFPVRLVLRITDRPTVVRAVPAELVEVLMNLVKNAAEAGGHRVEVRLEPAERGARLTVADDGPGIDPEVAEHLFDPYVTSKAEHGGTGVGLSVVRESIRRHGGDIVVRTAAGQGTTFEVWLPTVVAGSLATVRLQRPT